MEISGYYQLTSRDQRGRVVMRLRRKSRSYLRAFADWLCTHFGDVLVASVTTAGVAGNLSVQQAMSGLGPNDNSLFGPVVGTGTNAVAIADHALQTQIAHGTGSGQLDHQLTEVLNLGTSGSTRSFQSRRVFINSSGGAITINECGIYIRSGTPLYFCVVRDVVSPGVAVPDGGSGTLIYTLGVTA